MTAGIIFLMNSWWIELHVHSGYATVAALHPAGLRCKGFAALHASSSSWSFLIPLYAINSCILKSTIFCLLPWMEALMNALQTISSSIAVNCDPRLQQLALWSFSGAAEASKHFHHPLLHPKHLDWLLPCLSSFVIVILTFFINVVSLWLIVR